MEGSWEGIAGCVVHVAVHGECVSLYVVGGVACEGMFLVGCVHGYKVSSNRMLYYRMKLTFRLLFCSLHHSIYTACTKHCCVYSDEDCRIAVEISAFF